MAEATRSGLKSRVRENRTPGSVRGRLGNWPSYRDGVQTESESKNGGYHESLATT